MDDQTDEPENKPPAPPPPPPPLDLSGLVELTAYERDRMRANGQLPPAYIVVRDIRKDFDHHIIQLLAHAAREHNFSRLGRLAIGELALGRNPIDERIETDLQKRSMIEQATLALTLVMPTMHDLELAGSGLSQKFPDLPLIPLVVFIDPIHGGHDLFDDPHFMRNLETSLKLASHENFARDKSKPIFIERHKNQQPKPTRYHRGHADKRQRSTTRSTGRAGTFF